MDGPDGRQNPQKLTNVEAQRIMAILDETHSKLQLLSHVPPLRRVANFEAFQEEVGREVSAVLDEQVLLEQQYKWVSTPHHEQQQELASGHGFADDHALPDFETLDDELRHSTRVVCRMLREAPGISAQLKVLNDFGPSGAMRKYLNTVVDLRGQTYTKLSTSVEEEKAKEDWFLEISAREEKASQTLRQLQKEIKTEKAEREREVSSRNETIQKLREELELIKSSTLAEEKQLDADTKSSESADQNAFLAKEGALADELAKLTKELEDKRAKNKESEEGLRKKKLKFEGEVSSWITKYDGEMEEKDREISALRLIYDEEKKELDRLEAYFEKLMAERAAAMEVERKKAEERARQQAQMAALSKAATMLQKIWRGKQGRDAATRGKAGKAKGGKKKKVCSSLECTSLD